MLPTVGQEAGARAGGRVGAGAGAGNLRDIVARRNLGVVTALARVVTRPGGRCTAIAGVGLLKVWTSGISSG